MGQMAVARASLGGVLGCVLLSLALGSSNVDFGAPPASFYPRFNPFFFLCTHHAEMEGAGVAEGGGEVLLTLQITGNPSSYSPGQEYQGEICLFRKTAIETLFLHYVINNQILPLAQTTKKTTQEVVGESCFLMTYHMNKLISV
uniref:Reelin domain-containing protein n=1 Tax=Poecilia latipinna TaxID=48699 RepID=A0A3B3VC22_9TELE